MTFKVCTSCLPHHSKPVSLSKRVCPTCGARGRFAFRKPTDEEHDTEMARRAKAEAFLQKLLKGDRHETE